MFLKKIGGRMQVSGGLLPGYRVYEYLLVLTPHEELKNKIINVRKDFAEKFDLKTFAGSARLPLVNFMQYDMMEERLLNRLKIVAMGQTAFKVELKDFGSFPSHSIYINVHSRPVVQSLVREVRSAAQRLMKMNDENKPLFMNEPHLNIATRLLPWQYEKGWLEYSHKNFTGRFIADEMVLLRKPAGEAGFKVVQRFQFENMPVNIKQGELFG